MRILGEADIVGLAHTGVTNTCGPVLPGFKPIACTPRTFEPRSGGVAVYAKDHIAKHVRLADEHAEFGITWVCVSGMHGQRKPIYIAMCYLPPDGSAYYKHARGDTTLSILEHAELLHCDIPRHLARGHVLMMGDFNAHTGEGSDIGDLHVWDGIHEGHMDVPSELHCMHGMLKQLPPRHNQNNAAPIDKLGKLVLELCTRHNLVILNGRLDGDKRGAYTFHSSGADLHSTLDYFIASPELVYSEDGHNAHASYMRVWHALPPHPTDGKHFDHVPLLLRIGMGSCTGRQDRCKATATRQGNTSVTYRWRDTIQNAYALALLNESYVHEQLQRVADASMSVDQRQEALAEAIIHAVHVVHAEHGGVIRRMHGNAGESGSTNPHNGWYSDECKAARRVFVAAKAGNDPACIDQAYKAYKRTTRHARMAWEQARHMDLMRCLYHEPKSFWRTYGGHKKASGLSDVAELTRQFATLYKADGNTCGTSAECAASTDNMLLFPTPDAQQIQAAKYLNQEITAAEVHECLRCLKRGKAAGGDGIPAEFLRYACISTVDEGGLQHFNLLCSPLAQLFNAVLVTGCYPQAWCTVALVPVPKPKGNPDCFDDHRGIAVGSAVSKLYSMVMMKRMDSWAESRHLRADGQAGFRLGRSTVDNAFVLNHIVEKYAFAKKPIFAAFIDFRKAYDRIVRCLLWQCLQSLGVHGQALTALQQMYAHVTMQVRMNGQVGIPFASEMGVKQGDPLSPLLFGLFIDRIEAFMRAKCPAIGVDMAGMIVQVLLYADDLVIMAESPAALQQLLACLSTFCHVCGMTVNVRKSEVVVFNVQHATRLQRSMAAGINFGGQALVLSEYFIYLGMLFPEGSSVADGLVRNLDKAKKAAYVMFKRCYSMNMHNVHMLCHLFDALVVPIVSYGCELWGPYLLASKAVAEGKGGSVEVWHRSVLRQIVGVRTNVPTPILMNELGRKPLSMSWLKQTLHFWNKIVARPDNDLVKMAMAESTCLAATHRVRSCWAARLNSALGHLDCAKMSQLEACDVPMIMSNALHKWQASMWGRVPDSTLEVRSVPDSLHVGFRLYVYKRWFHLQADCMHAHPFTYYLFDREQIRAVAQYRMGVHWLNSVSMKRSVPRSKRHCGCCSVCEDEMHLFECPLYASLRGRFGCNLPNHTDDGMLMLMSGEHDSSFWSRFANFLIKCKGRHVMPK